ncbi:YycC family protein [Paenibacillus sp. ACRRX]|uniref:YycC family protein n=1 Tax=unclassified Paenibacillus TaxID=185978 RepID=UPI001EF7468D|nr:MULTISPECIES: YycC family protein [unclassified Paenibacillus]MCG7410423.1 YycC family protein [Paenibacillus sp. ACRRX]MDK8183845.1 YycC family protein [Paenibacillus sp. UMB4589-SE434]
MRPLPISADTAVKLSKAMGVPLEQLMHMPQHILLKKLAELADKPADNETAQADSTGEPS